MNQIYSVAQISKYIKNLFGQDYLLNQVSVRGEISGWKDHPSGHLYFNLRDAESVISVVMFQGYRATGIKTSLREGMKVVVTGSVEVYTAGGKYQLYAKRIAEDGEGERYRAYLELKKRLEEMGMFDASFKKPIPKYALKVGVVTASSGAALQDIIRVTRQRNPYVELILSPAQVQGNDAPKSIVEAIRKLDAWGPDVMIVGRGGGSYDDLYCFNDESVARAIFDASTPVISAVGHEVDYTIADFVADYRAATPSQAAEIAVFDYQTFQNELKRHRDAGVKALLMRTEAYGKDLSVLSTRMYAVHPKNVVREELERVASCHETILRLMNERIALLKQKTAEAFPALSASLTELVRRRKEEILRNEPKLNMAIMKIYHEQKEKTAVLAAKLQGLSPLEKLKNGYGYVSTKQGAVKSARDVSAGDAVSIRLSDGVIETEVKGIQS